MHWNKFVILAVTALLSFSGCKKNQSTSSAPNQAISYTDYSEDWQEIKKMEDKGLGKAIIEKSNEILEKALAENNINQVFKALAYRSKYSNHIEEESTLHIITTYEAQIDSAGFPLKQLLHSATAELYFQYYNQNRWRFSQRTHTENFEPEDIRSWSLEQIIGVINEHYLASLAPKKELSQFPTSSFKYILNASNLDSSLQINAFDLRPSIYDFLADRALQHFQQNEGSHNRPIAEFDADNYPIFSTVDNYIAIDFSSKDSNAADLRSLEIYQELLELHQKDKNPAVLVDFNLKRLQFAYNISNHDLKDSLYLSAIRSLSAKYENQDVGDEIDFNLAQLYFRWGSEYNSSKETETKRWYLKEAHQICVAKEGKNSFGAKQCLALKQNIEMQNFSFQTENTYLPDEAILFRFQYRNVDSVFFRLVQVPHNYNSTNQYQNQDALIQGLVSKKTIRKWSETLPNPADFQQHSIELFTKTLPKGNYYLLASTSNSFQVSSDQIAYSNIEISQLSYISRRAPEGNLVDIYALDRASGAAVPNARVMIYSRQYNYNSRTNSNIKIDEYKTDNDGFVSIKQNTTGSDFQIGLISKNDTLSPSSSYYLYKNNTNTRTVINTHFFTDRAIYRPRQTVYFKGIVIESTGKTKNPKANYKTKVALYNVNGEELSKMELSTNEYGSYQGSFVLPESGLNGQYRIKDQNGQQFFSVEEYKRPTFSIKLDSSENQQKINESVVVNGKVEAYSGALISDAQVQYRVYRRATYPSWSYLRSFIPPTNQKEIANGVLKTDEKGAFNFEFLAQADQSIQAKWNPAFNYEVVLDATSPSGETQSLTKSIRLSNQSVFLSTNLDDAIQLKELKALKIEAKNSNGKVIPANAELILKRLKTPENAKKPLLWSKAEYKSQNNKEFHKIFPSYPSEKEADLESFELDYEVSKSSISCNKTLNLFRELKPGAYEISVHSTDSFGQKVNLTKRFVLFNEASAAPAFPMFQFFESLNSTLEPGDTAHFIIGSSLKNMRLLYEIEHENKIVESKWISLNNAQTKISIPVIEAYRGNFYVHFTGVHSDRTIQYSSTIHVPFSNKKLKVQLGTFRDKVQPNSKEKWTLSISGKDGDAAVAEILGGMYDQSLDQFKEQDWALNLYHSNYSHLNWDINKSFQLSSSRHFYKNPSHYTAIPHRIYPSLNWFGFRLGYGRYGYSEPMMARSMSADEVQLDEAELSSSNQLEKKEKSIKSEDTNYIALEKSNQSSTNPIRSDFRETVFFYPQLRSNENGKVSFEFTMPEALTQWKFRALAHTKDLKIGTVEQSIRTQKELMVIPNAPRFFREGDQLNFKALINNLSEKPLNGYARLQFFDAINGNKINISNGNSADQKFEVESNGNTTVSWNIKIPEGLKVVSYRIEALSENFSDGEEKAIPVLPNRMLVTESLPLWIRGNETITFRFEKLLHAANEKTLSHESFTLEFTSNPAWYAIQALPNLSENGNECSEQVFSRLYANSLAEKIANSNPQINAVFEQWKQLNSEELTSKLMQNKALKSILIEETPWLQLAKNETEQKKRIALLFDFNRMANEKRAAIDKLSELQLPNGGWAWYKGMHDNRYITQYIVEGLGHLKKLGVDLSSERKLQNMLQKAVQYLDQRATEDYARLLKNKADLSKNHLGNIQIHYLYTRSFFQETPLPKEQKFYTYYINQAEEFWLNRNNYQQGLIALALHRIIPESAVPNQIMLSLKDNAIQNEEMGMYWKNNTGGYYWYQAPIETQALMIELFEEVGKDQKSVEELKIWLLKQKQTQAWSNSKATASACYALLMSGNNILSTESQVKISVGNEKIDLSKESTEVGTGYYKKTWSSSEVNSTLGEIEVKKENDGIAWGAAYWQFYQDLDQISSAKTGALQLSKTLFKVVVSEKGESMSPIDASAIKVGDKIRVRIRLESDRNLEFVHLKDMRAAAFETTNVLSKYKYQDGLGYYESTKDASTNFFMDRLSKGVYVFEYTLRASLAGEFSNGISSIQCQYAPEFASHSKGRRLQIED